MSPGLPIRLMVIIVKKGYFLEPGLAIYCTKGTLTATRPTDSIIQWTKKHAKQKAKPQKLELAIR